MAPPPVPSWRRALALFVILALHALLLVDCQKKDTTPPQARVVQADLWIDDANGARGIEIDGRNVRLWVKWTIDEGAPPPIKVALRIANIDKFNWQPGYCSGSVVIDPARITVIADKAYRADVSLVTDEPCPKVKPRMWLDMSLQINDEKTQRSLVPKSLRGDGLPHSRLAPGAEQFAGGGGVVLPPADDGADLASYGKLLPPVGKLAEKKCPTDLPPTTLHVRYEQLSRLVECGDAGALPQLTASAVFTGWNGSKPIRQRLDICAGGMKTAGGGTKTQDPLPDADDASLVILRPTGSALPTVTSTMFGADGKKDGHGFRGGSADGDIFVIDRRRGTLACQASYHATNADSFNGTPGDDFAAQRNLGAQASSAIMGALTRIGAKQPDNLSGLD